MKNLLFITVDQWRGDSLGHLGHPFVRTPVLDQLARRGVSFAAHFGQSTPCAPSRASLFTSQYLHTHRVFTNQTPWREQLKTLPWFLRELGYTPTIAGYTSTLAPRAGRSSRDPGVNGPTLDPGWSVLREMDEGKLHYLAWLRRQGYGRFERFKDIFDAAPPGSHGLPVSPLKPAHTETAWIVDAAEEFIGYGRGDPWALHVSIFKPHPPCYATAPWVAGVAGRDALPECQRLLDPQARLAAHPFMAYAAGRIRADYLWNHLPGLASALEQTTIDAVRRAYWATCEEVDAQLGRLIDALAASGQAERTVIVLTSDHAEMLGDHGCFGKYTLFPESYHVPLIVADPDPRCDVTRGRVVDAFSEGVDVLPTVIDCLAGAPDPGWQGQSLRPYLLDTDAPAQREGVCVEYDFRYDPPALLGPLAELPEAARSVAVNFDQHALVATFPTLEPVVLARCPERAGFGWRTCEGEEHQALLLAGLQRLLRCRQWQPDVPLQVPLRGSMVGSA